jgi:hypothetical protein
VARIPPPYGPIAARIPANGTFYLPYVPLAVVARILLASQSERAVDLTGSERAAVARTLLKATRPSLVPANPATDVGDIVEVRLGEAAQ